MDASGEESLEVHTVYRESFHNHKLWWWWSIKEREKPGPMALEEELVSVINTANVLFTATQVTL